MRRAFAASGAIGLAVLALVPAVFAAGPPFPSPVGNQAVYDTAGALRPETITRAESTIDAIEARTGAEIAVYTQLVIVPRSTTEAEADAQALMDQWGVGRKGFDDGLVILFDLNESDPCHGQVQLYAGPGYAATYLSNEERQALFENEMLPLLRGCDLDGALNVAMDKIDANATAEHASTLNRFRVLNAVLGLVLAPLVLVLLIGGGLLRWYIAGRDPVYLDDPSILVPAPPPGLTPAAAAAVRDGSVTRRALTTASLDLAARGQIGFKAEEGGLFKSGPKIGIHTGDAVTGDATEQARLLRARSRPMDDATRLLLGTLTTEGGARGYIDPDDITKIGAHVAEFNLRLEKHLVTEGWFRERPSSAVGRWSGWGLLVIIAGVAVFIAGLNLPSSGAVLVGIALAVSGVALALIGSAMPQRTKAGAVIVAMLEAYRRTLQKTMALARSMGEVAQASAIPLIESPDDAVVWGVALGLQQDVENVLQRSAEDRRSGVAPGAYLPFWYMGSSPSYGGGGGGGWAPGLMSSSPIPDFGGMMAALGTIGNSPASSGSGGSGGGGFGGGGSGGGGGGSGGGF